MKLKFLTNFCPRAGDLQIRKVNIIPDKFFSCITSRGKPMVAGRFLGFQRVLKVLRGHEVGRDSRFLGVPLVPGLGPFFPSCHDFNGFGF